MPAGTTELRVFPVSIESFDAAMLEMDLYLRPADDAELVLYRSVGVQFTDEDRLRLIEQGVEFVYVPMQQHRIYRQKLTERLNHVFHGADIQLAERARIVRASCARMIEDVLLFPNQPEGVQMIAEISAQFADWARAENGQFSYLLDMSGHDYYTATHMVNVGVGCGLLGRELFPDDREQVAAFVQGGMLHDIGKRGIPEEILNKEGKFTDDEWRLVKCHPLKGYEELRAHPGVPAAVLEMARDHHERLDGRGYPQARFEQQLEVAARICAVIDVYDAMCAARPYRGPLPPDEVLRIMAEGRGTQFDADLLARWTAYVERLLREDPGRAQRARGAKAGTSWMSSALVPSDAGRGGDALPWDDENRRAHPRYAVRVPMRMMFVRQGKRGPVPKGHWFDARLLDISCGGMKVETPWPLTLNDLLDVEVTTPNGVEIKRRARVVRVRAGARCWNAGLSFIGRV